jgi:hypothetical protein
METERITLSQRERDRMRVLHEVQQGHLTQREAGRRLRLADRQVRRLLLRIRKYGDQTVIHALHGRPSTTCVRPQRRRRLDPAEPSNLA